jgi:antitoxin ParD1/3/4
MGRRPDSIRAIRQRRRQDALKREPLRVQIRAGIEALGRGEFIEVADGDLDRYLRRLAAIPRKPTR